MRDKIKSRIRQFFSGAPMPAKMGYLKGYYKTSITIIDGRKYTWQQVADRIDLLIQQRRYGNPAIPETGWEQMNLFEKEEI